jgi:hypothetical protein
MAIWEWILFWILVATPFVLNIRRVIRDWERNHRTL